MRFAHYVQDKWAKQPEGVLDISNSRLQVVANGFSLTKNGNTFEFTSKEDGIIKTWIEHLRGICVLVTFHEEYKAIKMIGKGSFAKVYLVESKITGKSFAVKAFTKESIIVSNKNNAKVNFDLVSLNHFETQLAEHHQRD